MRLVNVLVGLLALGVATCATAKVTIEFGDNVNVLAVNQERPDIDGGGLFSSTRSVSMPNGENQIVFRYELFFEDGVEREEVNSQVIIAKFNATNTTLKFQLPTFRDAEAAQKAIDPLSWSLVTETGQTVEHSEDILTRPGVQFGRNFPSEAREYNLAGGKAALTMLASAPRAVQAPPTAPIPPQQTVSQPAATGMSAPQPPVAPAAPQGYASPPAANYQTPKTPAAPANTAEEMLHFWYEKADEETKARFKAFINQQ